MLATLLTTLFLSSLLLLLIRAAVTTAPERKAATCAATMAAGPLAFRLTPSCVLKLARGDLTQWAGGNGAIVNAANRRMLGGGGVDGAIHRRAGPQLLAMCQAVPEVEPGLRCPTGEARITSGETGLSVQHVIHTVGPVYKDAEVSAPLLESAYRNSLSLANEAKLQTIAFPAISCGVYNYPYDEAAKIAVTCSRDHCGALEEIHFVLFEQPAWDAWTAAAAELGLEEV